MTNSFFTTLSNQLSPLSGVHGHGSLDFFCCAQFLELLYWSGIIRFIVSGYGRAEATWQRTSSCSRHTARVKVSGQCRDNLILRQNIITHLIFYMSHILYSNIHPIQIPMWTIENVPSVGNRSSRVTGLRVWKSFQYSSSKWWFNQP